jgi:hypothetical protein
MNFLALNDDVKFIIATHLASDLKIRTLLSKNHASKLSIGLTGRGPDMHVYICQYVHAGDLAAQHH